MRTTLLALATLAIGCGGSKDSETTTNTLPTFIPGGDSEDTGPTSTALPPLDPVAVGFEVIGYLGLDGTLTDFIYAGGTETTPAYIRLTFANAEFFDATTSEEQVGHFCEAYAPFNPTPFEPNAQPFNTHDNAILSWSYEEAIPELEYELVAALYPCAGLVDADVWGANAELLIQPFIGAHFGMGYAPLTEYLEEQYSDFEDVKDFLFTNYIAINDKDGHWGGCDWTSGLIYEADPITHEFILDADDAGIFIDVTGVVPGQPYPEGILITNAYWYQDFPLMDLSNLTDWTSQPGDPLCE